MLLPPRNSLRGGHVYVDNNRRNYFDRRRLLRRGDYNAWHRLWLCASFACSI